MSFFWQMAFSQMQSSGRWLLKRIGGGGGASHGLTWPLMRSWPRRLCGKARSGGWKRRTFSTAHWHPRPVKALADVCVLGAGCLSTCGGPLFEFFGAVSCLSLSGFLPPCLSCQCAFWGVWNSRQNPSMTGIKFEFNSCLKVRWRADT